MGHGALSKRQLIQKPFYSLVPQSLFPDFRSLFHYNVPMTAAFPPRRRSKLPPPGETGQEALYLRSLSDRQVNVQVKLRDGETVRGWIEYFDDAMVRLTREGLPNLFIYKHQIRTITETAHKRTPRPRATPGAPTGMEAAG